MLAEARAPADTPQSQGFSLREFIHDEAFSGILLLVCALIALVWANSPWGATYDAVWSTELTLGTVQFHLTESLRHSSASSSLGSWPRRVRPRCRPLPPSVACWSPRASTPCSIAEP